MTDEDKIPADSERYKKANAFLRAGIELWEYCRKDGEPHPLRWVEGTGDELVVFTKSEYKAQIKNLIESFGRGTIQYFEQVDEEE